MLNVCTYILFVESIYKQIGLDQWINVPKRALIKIQVKFYSWTEMVIFLFTLANKHILTSPLRNRTGLLSTYPCAHLYLRNWKICNNDCRYADASGYYPTTPFKKMRSLSHVFYNPLTLNRFWVLLIPHVYLPQLCNLVWICIMESMSTSYQFILASPTQIIF